MEDCSINKIIKYWFGHDEYDCALLIRQSQFWFNGGSEVDAYITHNFQELLELATCEKLNSWKQTKTGFLALIILLDQFPRNIYRNTYQAFAYDFIALNTCLEGLSTGKHRQLPPIQKKFFYMPLQHSESLEIQKKSVYYFTELLEEAPSELKHYFEDSLRHAKKHKKIIEKFGRFLHRDKILGRETSLEELEFIKITGNSF